MKKYIYGLILILILTIGYAKVTRASVLPSNNIDAILSILQVFDIPADKIEQIKAILSSDTPAVPATPIIVEPKAETPSLLPHCRAGDVFSMRTGEPCSNTVPRAECKKNCTKSENNPPATIKGGGADA